MKTAVTKPHEVTRDWYHIDAEGKTLGRLAVAIADLLRGKGKPNFDPSVDCGDFVVVTNAEKVVLTGRKLDQKVYRHHTGHPGGFRQVGVKKMLDTHPHRVLEKAVRGMIPHNKLGDRVYTKLKVYAGAEHPHSAQQPKTYEVTEKGERARG